MKRTLFDKLVEDQDYYVAVQRFKLKVCVIGLVIVYVMYRGGYLR